ncbi:probable DNA-directed RNA polymerase subunit delta [Microplitis mediator]|uniref:probable DNA-directed RNA polymerase subunit delta n=1 Tax=Microplitis mediator TaxID=375433 RepID=UPI002552656A|nr:probable DNA-directed RNA polymerase subunit delta [Microplitis mediator]
MAYVDFTEELKDVSKVVEADIRINLTKDLNKFNVRWAESPGDKSLGGLFQQPSACDADRWSKRRGCKICLRGGRRHDDDVDDKDEDEDEDEDEDDDNNGGVM